MLIELNTIKGFIYNNNKNPLVSLIMGRILRRDEDGGADVLCKLPLGSQKIGVRAETA
jgi:hypothetical protein